MGNFIEKHRGLLIAVSCVILGTIFFAFNSDLLINNKNHNPYESQIETQDDYIENVNL